MQGGFTGWLRCDSPLEVEAKAIRWAAELMDEIGWRNLEWTFDGAPAVEEITSTKDPCRWSTRFDMLKVQSLFAPNGWKIGWQSRLANSLADATSKWILLNNRPLYF